MRGLERSERKQKQTNDPDTPRRKDPRYHCKDAKLALDEELRNLKSRGTWDFNDVMWSGEARRKYPDGNFSHCFGLIGINNAEVDDASEWVWKGRIVFGGDQVRTGSGDWAIFEDVGSVPTSMSAARILLACKMLMAELVLCQSDCISAYVQADLPPDDVTYVTLPRE